MGTLSVNDAIVNSRQSHACTKISCDATCAARSKSELVIVPLGFDVDTKFFVMCVGKVDLHKMGVLLLLVLDVCVALFNAVCGRSRGLGGLGGSSSSSCRGPITHNSESTKA